MGERTPDHRLFAVFFDEGEVIIGVGAELLDHLFVAVGIFVGADVHTRTTEHRILTREIFGEKTVHKRVDFGIREVEMVHSILFRTKFGTILRKGENVRRRVDFGDDFDVQRLGEFLQFDEFGLRIVTVLGGKTGIGVALEAERG